MTTNQANMNRNPKGHGGFSDYPEHRSNGRWDKNNSISYWMNYFIRLTVAEFRSYEKDVSENKRSVAQSIAYARVFVARSELKESEFVTNRTEGYPTQPVEQTNIPENLDSLSEEDLRTKIREIDRKLGGNI